MIGDGTGDRRRPDWGDLFRRVNRPEIWKSTVGDMILLRHRCEVCRLLECAFMWCGEMYPRLERI